MPIGHIKLGAPGALRDYLLVDPKRRVRSLANPMAAKLGSGLGNYDDMQNWAGFLMEDWQAGIGKKDPTAGGSLYSTSETRFPNRLLLSYAPIQPDTTYADNYNLQPGIAHPQTEISVGSGASIKRISQKITSYGGYSELAMVYLKNEGKGVTIESYSDSGGKPTGSALNTVTLTTNDYGNGVGYSTYLAQIDPNKAAAAVYHIVIYPTSGSDTIHVPVTTTNSETNTYNGSTWSTYASYSLMVGNINQTGVSGQGRGVVFNQTYYFAREKDLCKVASGTTTVVHSFANYITDLAVVGTTLWIGFGTAGSMYTMSTSEVFTVDGGANQGYYFAKYNGYLWRSLDPDVWYTGDGSTWTQVNVADTGETIYSLAGVGDYLYVATSQALYYIGAGDQVRMVTPWPNLGDTPVLLTYQGALYVAFGESVVKYDGGTVLPMGPDLGEGLPSIRDGVITCMACSNYWFFIGIQPSTNKGRSTIWAWNAQGWHHIATLPGNDASGNGAFYTLVDLCYDRYTNTLWANDGQIPLKLTVPDVANYNDGVTVNYQPQSWLETDWFFGNLREISKDMESIYISADVCDANRYVELYWKDDDSTAWELLGTVTSQRQEVRWSSYTTRPNTKQIKLGIALYSKTANSTPIVRAIRLKYMTMVQDRYRWSLPIAVSDNQQMVDGKVNPYTAAQMRSHLESLITRVPPLILEDMDANRYEVKVLAASEQPERFEYIDGQKRLQSVYTLQVEQATTGTYSGN